MRRDFRHVFTLRDGETLIVDPADATRSVDRRGSYDKPQAVWTIKLPNGGFKTVWTDEIAKWDMEPIKEDTGSLKPVE
jgi:hypothetical protein